MHTLEVNQHVSKIKMSEFDLTYYLQKKASYLNMESTTTIIKNPTIFKFPLRGITSG